MNLVLWVLILVLFYVILIGLYSKEFLVWDFGEY